MIAHYPRFVAAPTSVKPDREVIVKNADDHKKLYPEDYNRFMNELSGDPTGGRFFAGAASAAEERERCAVVAETYPKAGKLGLLIASAIRGQFDLVFPKVLRNPESSPVKGGEFTQAGAKPDTFIRADVTVADPLEEGAARADGFTVTVTPEAPNAPNAPVNVPKTFPKLLRDPRTEEKADAAHTEIRDGRYAKPDVSVANPGEEVAAVAKGFTVFVK